MKNFPVQHEGKTYWIARNTAVTCFVFAPIDGEWCILANKRGKNAPDYFMEKVIIIQLLL